MESTLNGVSIVGMLFQLTKNPANNMKGIISTGVSVTASCLSAKIVPKMRAYPAEALQIRNKINKNTGNLKDFSVFNPTTK